MRGRIRIFVWLLLSVLLPGGESHFLHAQTPYLHSDNLPITIISLSEKTAFRQNIYHREILVEPACTLDLSGVLAQVWTPIDSTQWPDGLDGCYWLRERIRVPVGTSDLIAEVGYHSYSEVWVLQGDSVVQHSHMGNELPLERRANPAIWVSAYRNTVPLSLKPLSAEPAADYTIVYRAWNPYGSSIFGKNAPLRLVLHDASVLAKASAFHQKASYALAGSLFALLLYQILQLFVYRSRVNAVFCAMLFCVLVYVSYENFLLHDLFPRVVFRESVLIVFGELAQVMLFLFTRGIFREKAIGTRALRIIDGMVVVKLVEMVVWLAIFQLRYAGYESLTPWMSVLPDVFRLSTIACLLVYFGIVALLAFRVRGWATRSILLGNAALTLSVIVYVVQALLHDYEEYAVVQLFMYLVDPILNYCVEIGIVSMSLCFSLSVAILTKERERSIEQRYAQQLANTEMSALRAQMNPHFLFNGLNSIKRFVIQNEPQAAGVYLSKFAQLIRLILENSKSSLVTLEQELDTLRLYMELESLRFDHKFSYDIAVDEDLAPELVEMPPTLLQPYVENAIWHGLLHREMDGGHVQLTITPAGPRGVRFVIEDNGVGRKRATLLKSRSATTHKSLGLKITADRLRLLHDSHGLDTAVEIDDLEIDGRPTGTRVTITLHNLPPAESTPRYRVSSLQA